MGIGYNVVEGLIRESKYRPFRGDVMLIGRQTVYFTPSSILELLRTNGIDVKGLKEDGIELDRNTIDRLQGYETDKLITDAALFKLLGVPKVLALDHSDYEGAEIIHDLTTPIPESLEACADFILDGSTLDNVFDPAMVIRNFAGMLRPGGRLITTNVYSNTYEPYVMLPPLWFMDYFVMNKFADCKIYIVVSMAKAEFSQIFTLNIDSLLDSKNGVSAFTSPYTMATIVIAEKGAESTTHVMPSQQHYRSEKDWSIYRENLSEIMKSERPHICRSIGEMDFTDIRRGHLFVDRNYTAQDPMSEIVRAQAEKEAADLAVDKVA